MRARLGLIAVLVLAVAASISVSSQPRPAYANGVYGTAGNVLWTDPKGDASDPVNGEADDLDLIAGAAAYNPVNDTLRFYLTVNSLSSQGADETAPYYEYEMRWTYGGQTYFAYMVWNDYNIVLPGPFCGMGTVDIAGNEYIQSPTLAACGACAVKPGYFEMDVPAHDAGISRRPATGAVLTQITGMTWERSVMEYYDRGYVGPGVQADQGGGRNWTVSTLNNDQKPPCPPPPTPPASGTVGGSQLVLGQPPAAAAVRTDRVMFAHEAAIDPARGGSAPAGGLDPRGNLYVTAPAGGQTYLWTSGDGGGQFSMLRCNDEIQNAACAPAGGSSAVASGTSQPPPQPPSPANPPAIYYAALGPSGALTCAYSYNGGTSFNISGPAFVQPLGEGQGCSANGIPSAAKAPLASGRPSMAVKRGSGKVPIDTVYVLYQSAAGSPVLLKSPDAGQDFVQVPTVGAIGTNVVSTGNLVVDQATGDLYAFMTTHDPASGLYGVQVDVSSDGGIHFHQYNLSGARSTASTAGAYAKGAQDTAGNLYVVWSTAATSKRPYQTVYFAHSTDGAGPGGIHGRSWSGAVALNGPGSPLPKATAGLLPSVVAGSPGRVDVAFYGSQHALPFAPQSDSADWYVDFLQTLNGRTSAPSWRVSMPAPGSTALAAGIATQAPVHHGAVCFLSATCAPGSTGLGDALTLVADGAGRATILFSDDSDASGSKVAVPSLVQQATGRSIYASADGGRGYVTAPQRAFGQAVDVRSTSIDYGGDALFPAHSTTAKPVKVPGLDILATKVGLQNPHTLKVTLTFADIPSAPGIIGCAFWVAVAGGTECTFASEFVVTWRYAGSLYFAGTTLDWSWFCGPGLVTDTAGTGCASKPHPVAGRAVPVAGGGFSYTPNPAYNLPIQFNYSPKGRTHDLDLIVPLADVGSPKPGQVLQGLQSFTMMSEAFPHTVQPGQPFNELIDSSAPIDYGVGSGASAGSASPLDWGQVVPGQSAAAAAPLRPAGPQAAARPAASVIRPAAYLAVGGGAAMIALLVAIALLWGPVRRRRRPE